MTPAIIETAEIGPASRRRDPASSRRRARRRVGPQAHDQGRVNIGLWIPTTAIFVVLAPFAIVLTPFLYLAPRDMRPDPFRMITTLGVCLLALTGTVVEIDAPDARIRLRFF